MSSSVRRKLPPIWLFVVIFLLAYSVLSAVLTMVLKLPWRLPLPVTVGVSIGVVLLVLALGMMIWVLKSLGIGRAFGKELFLPKSESKLVTTGIYAYSRNPLYLLVLLFLLGWFFLFQLTAVLILTSLFLVHFIFVARWEERELRERFGQEYEDYKRRVPFFVPRVARK